MKIPLPKSYFRFLIVALLFVGQFAIGQTTATYTFSVLGASNVTNPSGNIDANISYTSAKNSGSTSATYQSTGQDLRLYYATTGSLVAGSSIDLQANNGVTITGVEFESFSTSYMPTMKYSIGAAAFTTSDPTIGRIGATAVYTVSGLNITTSMKIRNANTTNEQMRMMYIKVTYNAPVVGPPVVSNATQIGNFGNPFSYQVIATNNATSYAVVSGSSLPAGLNLNNTTGLITGSPSVLGSITTLITATNSAGTSAPATISFNIEKGNQTITFAVLADKQYGDVPFNLNATTTSGLPITYNSNNANVATISGNLVTIIGIGSAEITASQAGNDNYNSAQLIRTFTVTRRNLTVTGLIANNKVEDGTTVASLTGTGVLNNVLPADAGQVILSGTPTATFAQASPGTNIPVSLASYTLSGSKAANYQITQPTGLTANITVLGTPFAITADEIGSNSFIAKWNAVVGATNYRLDVYTEGGSAPATDLFISEYIEGSANNKYLEIYNGTGAAVNLANYDLVQYNNGGSTLSAPLALTGTLANNSTYVIKNSLATIWTGTANVSTTNTVMGFNGNDVIALRKSGVNIDVVGVIGAGTADFAKDVTLTRNAAVSSPSTTYNAANWNISTIDNVSNLGSHTFSGGSSIIYVSGYENLSVGNVTSHLVSGLNPETQYFYRVRAINGTATSPNSNTIEVTTTSVGTTCIWDGEFWSNNNDGPDASIDADIRGVYDTDINGVFTARNLTITSGSLTVRSGGTITIIEDLNHTLTAAAVVFENNANLIQGGTSNGNSGEITVKRNSSALKRQDYTMWSSPTTGNQKLLGFSPETLENRFYTYNTTTNQYNAVLNTTNSTSPAATTFDLAKGYLIRMPNGHPTSPTIWEGIFKGLPNNGNISYSLENDGIGKRFNAVGNPYPSPIDAFAFVDNAANFSSITGTLYFWRKTNNAESPSYSSWTRAGFVSNGEAQNVNPNGVIQTGQGFIVEGTGNGTAVQFSNAMRVNNHANQFFKTSNTVEYNRIWLNATNADGLFSQTLVGYITDSSDDLDRADGKYMNDGPIALTSIINDTPYAIQARSLPFQASDIVPLQFTATDAGTYTISIDHVDGLFETDQAIYLRDALTGAEQDLKEGAYTFASDAGTFADRFNLAYANLLSVNNSVLDANSIVVFKNDAQSFTINSGNATMQTVKVFDIRGRLLATQNNINAIQTTVAAGQANEVLLIQVTSVDGITVTKKVVR